MDDDFKILSREQSEMLHQFQEVTNTQDKHMALATLESLNWDLQRAIETQLISNRTGSMSPMELDDTPTAGAAAAVPPPPLIDTTTNNDENSHGIAAAATPEYDIRRTHPFSAGYLRMDEDDDDFLWNHRLVAGSSVGRRGTRSSPRLNGMSAMESSSGIRTRRIPITTTTTSTTTPTAASSSSSVSGLSSRVTRSRSRPAQVTGPQQPQPQPHPQQNPLSVVTSNNGSSLNDGEQQSDTDSDDDIFHDAAPFTGSIDDEEDAKPRHRDDRVPLVPEDFTSIDEAMHNFVAVFESRYGGNHPPFYQGSLQDAIREAFEAPGRPVAERRPLAVYLHNDRSVACNIFAKNVLCSDIVSSLLKGQFITWPWDMTQKENRHKLFEWMDMLNVRDMRRTLEKLSNERFPLLVIIIKEKGVVQPVDVAWGCDGAQQVVDKLMEGLDQYQHIKSADAAEERERIEREEIRQEQAREYERSLAQDRARQERLERERNEQKAEEERRVKAEQDKTRRLQELAASLPEEPGPQEAGVATVRVRFPDGNMQIRRFRMTEPLRNVTTFVESKGYSLDTHRIWTSDVPKKNLVESYDLSRTLADIKWPIREQVTVDEK